MIQLVDITKTYLPDINVLNGINLEISNGEILAIIGHNGSGKSTLLSILAGISKPTGGRILLDGNEVAFNSIFQAQKTGFELLQQQPAIFPHLSIVENMFAGNEITSIAGGLNIISKSHMLKIGKELLADYGIQINDLNRLISTLSGGQKAIVSFIRAVRKLPKVLALDEPTAALGPKERDEINRIIRKVASQGVAVVLVTHIMRDVIALAHKVAILKDGKIVFYNHTVGLKESDLLKYMD